MESAAPPRLTELSHGAGCACKLPPGLVHDLVSSLPRSSDPALIVGQETIDDAAVYRLSDDVAVVTTVDFFTPIVDDPYDFGRIAAANALSDVYAMGGRPLTALNLVAYSIDDLGTETLGEILRGGGDVVRAAGAAVVGGHSIDDTEPKYGLAVTGVVHPERVVRNSTARAGDSLWLSKPVGGGVASTAVKRGVAGSSPPIGAAVQVMTMLNRDAADAALDAGAAAMTDVTGYGLLGHLHELCEASGVAAVVDAGAVPAIDGVLDLLASAEPPIAGGTRRNREWIEPWVEWGEVSVERRWLLCDAMTSGGLLVALPPARRPSGALGVRIGTLVDGAAGRIRVTTSGP
ncbi:MAG: selenide, water dikinase SelD [Actinobacteria bacterium]|nr:selenide, water dikinase SelD [Actinomycetota bacterium]